MSVDLDIEGLTAGYGRTVVLEGISLSVSAGGSLAILGRNGVGKTTLLATLMGFTTVHGGRIGLGGRQIGSLAPYLRNRMGLGYVPQEREIFASLTVAENLAISRRDRGWPLERVYALFPALAERRGNAGNKLSGGEQQMLAIGRALVGGPKVLLLDEPMEGLAPVVVDALYDALRAIRDEGSLTILLVEHKAELAMRLTDRTIVLDRGRIVHDGPSAALLADAQAQARLLGVGTGATGLA